ncbi:hemolysin family protein [Maricaulis sp.]|jgi:hemolysin (HlyC) family protein|uniref:transporter associated domain-containing protein n=1 Tax=Maricaulis sp. TaxID=1486257 RepID=UPI0025D27478|nr:hemolysin family protein [Maricaulis sp.]MDF1767609.1 hemolysin family protein [Maricaulis sp.]
MTDTSAPSDPDSRPWFSRLFSAGHRPRGTGAAAPTGVAPNSIEADALDKLRVADVMVPRADIIGVDVATPLGELAKIFAHAAHSRLPIYRDTLDDPVGVVHIKDVVSHLAPGTSGKRPAGWSQQQVLPSIGRPLLFAPPSMKALDLLRRMQGRRMHLALVVDEYGGTDGLVTLEDLIEPIVGDIEDEHDDEETPAIRARGPGVWDVEARAEIDAFEAVVGEEIAAEDEDEDVDSLGGLVFTLIGRVPERGEVIRHPTGYEFEVIDADTRRIKRMRVRAPQKRPDKSVATGSDNTDAG